MDGCTPWPIADETRVAQETSICLEMTDIEERKKRNFE